MTTPDTTFELNVIPSVDGVLYAELAGDLAWDSADELLEAVRAHLDTTTGPSDIRLDCARMALCDSMGLSTLLALHRRAAAAGVRLHLDHRPASLDRLLVLTGTYEHLTGRSAPAGPETARTDGDTLSGTAEGPWPP
ncbi:STAS domain-containing protein [Streptomyces sp. NPDC096079]|uniref:STAS domain-containing protein n=1 Tax=Streptomyces sp. NPDC096079 TaxID=3155820 RepID=UPI003318BF4A